ncbi:hypothetical protein PABG_12523 [Paracoccidioides brasiliensis Pb03]|nr:hypothetical protein PABG_12523 [Paracoccidioides brasiliensis Pb03]
MEKHLPITALKKGETGTVSGSATETVRLLRKISLQLEQMTPVLRQLSKVPMPSVPIVKEEFGGKRW